MTNPNDEGRSAPDLLAQGSGPGVRVLRLPCADEDHARRFVGWLTFEEVDVRGHEDRHVLVPMDNMLFAWDVAEAAVGNGFADDEEACAAVGEFLKEWTP